MKYNNLNVCAHLRIVSKMIRVFLYMIACKMFYGISVRVIQV